MPFSHQNGLRYFTIEIFPGDLIQAVFTRQGGVSPRPWDSLNVGGSIGDDSRRVRQNRVRSFEALDRDPDSIFDVWQVHSAEVVCADAPRPLDSQYQQADAILTDNPQVSLFMRFADCTPILLYDPVRKVVGLAHAGWLGTVRGAAREAVGAMRDRYGCAPVDVLAAIGPSIGPDHYEVGQDVIEQVNDSFGAGATDLLQRHGNRLHFDLWEANRVQLEQAGVRQIEIAGLCTACHTRDWYSHRAEHGRTGRFGALIAMQG